MDKIYICFLAVSGAFIALNIAAPIIMGLVRRKSVFIAFVVISAICFVISVLSLLVYVGVMLDGFMPSEFYKGIITPVMIFALAAFSGCALGFGAAALALSPTPEVISEIHTVDDDRQICVRIKDRRMHGEYSITEK